LATAKFAAGKAAMTTCNRFVLGLIGYACWLGGAQAQATDINGAWARDADTCGRIFVKQGGRVSFARHVRLHGAGFIVENDRMTGRVANCRIRWQDKGDRQFIAKCTGYVMDTLQFTLKVIDDNKIGRVVAGKPDLEIYQRCLF